MSKASGLPANTAGSYAPTMSLSCITTELGLIIHSKRGGEREREERERERESGGEREKERD